MKRIDIIKSKKDFIISIIILTLMFCILGWIAYPKNFNAILPLTIIFAFISTMVPIEITYIKEKKFNSILKAYLSQPNQDDLLNELICNAPDKLSRDIVETLVQIAHDEKLKNKKLEESNINYSEYIETWVHEIKTPLALMQLVLDNNVDSISPEVKEKLLKSERLMEKEIEQVLYYSKTQESHKDFIYKKYSLGSLCKEVIKNKAELLLESNFSIEFLPMEEIVLTDKKCFTFILGQILDNSIKYSNINSNAYSENKIFKKITLSSSIEADKVILSISDNGPGVQKSQLPFIFDKGFVGTNGRMNGKSTGMGLYICKSLCYKLGIDITAKSENSQGLKIIFKFPII